MLHREKLHRLHVCDAEAETIKSSPPQGQSRAVILEKRKLADQTRKDSNEEYYLKPPPLNIQRGIRV
jgi:hypothetical protein